ncbi:hypothetical protein ABIF63_007082 [Bradyrhizobium japonicum]|uniref:Uncharacterized protein n=1 Tax=Bradyrhizobium japonicum TaxID=375 RepID=A0ABV2S1B1_BRAJP
MQVTVSITSSARASIEGDTVRQGGFGSQADI